MFLDPEPAAIVTDRIRRALLARGINAYDEGSVAKTLSDVYMDERANDLRDVRFVGRSSFLGTAENGFLDSIGEDVFNVERGKEAQSFSTELDGNVLVYVTTGVLADNLVADARGFYIPVDTILSDSTNSIDYITDKRIYIEQAATRAFISVKSVITGPAANVPAGALVRIDIDGIQVTNLTSINNGSSIEGDDNYRARLSRSFVAAQGSNFDAIEQAALAVPGVSSVSVQPRVNGPGTAQVIVIPEGNTTSQSVLSLVENAIDVVKSEETTLFVISPDYLSVSIDYSYSGRSMTRDEIDFLIGSTQSQARDYLSSLSFGDIIDPSFIILSALSDIVGVIGRVEKLCVNGVPIASKTYTLAQEELVILDITKLEPIRVFI